MKGRKWEELPTDCLVDVLGRVGMESLILDIPFICKSWYQASLIPLCWKKLDFSFFGNHSERKSFTSRSERHYGFRIVFDIKFIKGVVYRSGGCATYVKLPCWYGGEEVFDGGKSVGVEIPSCFEVEELSYFGDKCPDLKTLVLNVFGLYTISALLSVIDKFKNLEMLGIWGKGSLFKDIVTQIGSHCHNFTTLTLVSERCDYSSIGEDEVMTVVHCLPKLKALTLNGVRMERKNLVKLLNGCVGLVHLDVSGCYEFDESDEELLKLASHIPTFKSSGSVVHIYDSDEYDDYPYVDVDFDYSSDF